MNNELWLIWKEPKTRRRYKIGLLRKINNKYNFEYINPELNEALKVGFDYFPGFNDLNISYSSDKLFANIETRLPNVNRPDYLEILNSYNLDISSNKMDILRATKGRLLTDNYEFVPAFNNNKIEFDVAGTRHCKDLIKCKSLLNINDRLVLEPELDNIYDKDAIKVLYVKDTVKYHLGYVPRYYSKQFKEMLDKNIDYSAMIQNLNFESVFNDEDITAVVKLIFKK